MMRIVGGQWRGRKITRKQAGPNTRPTMAAHRETLFSLIDGGMWSNQRPIARCHVLDAFAGTGAVGLEAIARKADHVWFFDRSPQAVNGIDQSLLRFHHQHCASIWCGDVLRPPPLFGPVRTNSEGHQGMDLVFLDPPYRRRMLIAAVASLMRRSWIVPERTVVICQVHRDDCTHMQDDIGSNWIIHRKDIQSSVFMEIDPRILSDKARTVYFWRSPRRR